MRIDAVTAELPREGQALVNVLRLKNQELMNEIVGLQADLALARDTQLSLMNKVAELAAELSRLTAPAT